MANEDAAFGFRPINADGGPYTGQTERVVVGTDTSVATYIGTPVKITTTTADITGTPLMTVAAAGSPVFGVVTSYEADPNNLSLQYRAAATRRFAQVVRVDNAYFEVQAKANPGLANVNSNIALVITGGSAVTGLSGDEIVTPTVATGADCQIVRGVNREGNDLTASNSVWVIKFNHPRGAPEALGT